MIKKASVIIPLYNGISYVEKLLLLLKKNYKNLSSTHDMEVIFIKDSTESFDENLFKKYADTMPVKLLLNDKNYGIQYSRIKGVQHATGDYIHMLDQDDEVSDDFIENALNKIGSADVLVCNGKQQCMGYDKILYKYAFMQWTVKYKWFYTKFSGRILSPGHCLIKKTSIPKTWMEHILVNSGVDDTFLWLLMLSNGCKFKIDRSIRYIHHHTGVNLSANDEKMKSSLLEMIVICKKTSCLDSHSIKRIEANINRKSKSALVKMIEYINKIK